AQRLPLDAPPLPLQRVVLRLVRRRRRRPSHLPAPTRPARSRAAHRNRRRHPPLRRARGSQFAGPVLRRQRREVPPPPAHCDGRRARAALETGAELAHLYGLTETYGPHTICAWKPAWDKLPAPERALLKARQGVPYLVAGMDLRVADHYMNDVPADGQTMGEVLMRGNNVMLGYYDNPKATAEAFHGGWFHSGDLA